MTEDKPIAAIRATAAERVLPAPTSKSHVAETERAIGYPIRLLLRRLYRGVVDSGFGWGHRRFGVLGVHTPGTDEELITFAYDQGLWDLEEVHVPYGPVKFYDRAARCGCWWTSETRRGRCLARAVEGTLSAPDSDKHPESTGISAD